MRPCLACAQAQQHVGGTGGTSGMGGTGAGAGAALAASMFNFYAEPSAASEALRFIGADGKPTPTGQ